MSGTPSVSVHAKMAMDTALPFDTSSIPVEFESNSLGKVQTILKTGGLTGTRQQHVERTRNGGYVVNGTLTMPIGPEMMLRLLPFVLGAAGVGSGPVVFDIGEFLSGFYLMEDKGAKVWTWSSVVVSKLTLKAEQGKVLMGAFDLEAETQSIGNAGTFPNLALPTDSPWILADAVLTLQGSAREVSEIEIVIDNKLITDRMQNSLTRTEIPSNGLQINVNTNHPYDSSTVGLYDQATAGAAGTLVFTNSEETSNVLTIEFGALQVPSNKVETPNAGEIRLPLQHEALASGDNPAIRFTVAEAA